jgi:hypothetical protein
VAAVAAVVFLSVALKHDGYHCALGQTLQWILLHSLSVPGGLSDVVAARGNYHAVALEADGSVTTSGYHDGSITSVRTPAGQRGPMWQPCRGGVRSVGPVRAHPHAQTDGHCWHRSGLSREGHRHEAVVFPVANERRRFAGANQSHADPDQRYA